IGEVAGDPTGVGIADEERLLRRRTGSVKAVEAGALVRFERHRGGGAGRLPRIELRLRDVLDAKGLQLARAVARREKARARARRDSMHGGVPRVLASP